MMGHHILLCGAEAERIHSSLRGKAPEETDFSVVTHSYDLPGTDLVPKPILVVASADLADDPIFRSWRSRRLSDVPVVWITPDYLDSGGVLDSRSALVLPEDELSALPYLVNLAVRRDNPMIARRPVDRTRLPGIQKPNEIIGESEGIRRVLASARKVLNVRSSVLILGESGTGKELVASMIHLEGKRRDGPFIKVNCAAIPESLLESELFGIEKNTATLVDKRIGKFERADGGTIFLDEIGDMSLLTQAKVLRTLQEREIERVGGTHPIPADVRVIAATNKDLSREIREGRFRSDLYYRLNVINISIPPLRERREDIPILVEHFITRYCRANGLERKKVAEDVLDILMRHEWPGNIRELENTVERAVVIGEGPYLTPGDLPGTIQGSAGGGRTTVDEVPSFQKRVSEFERGVLIDALNRCSWVQARAARKLGMSERSMWHLFKKYRLDLVSRGTGKRGRRSNRKTSADSH